MLNLEFLLERFRSCYHRPATVLGIAPGRVNLIGEHTDYNGGFVLPAAINREVAVAFAPRDDGRIRLHAIRLNESDDIAEADAGPIAKRPVAWANYIVAVVEQLRARGVPVRGFDAADLGDVPFGAGLSSSAAIEMAVGIGLQALWGFDIAKSELALLGQAAEHSPFVGVNCGIMDQFVSALGQADHALLIDCDSLEYEAVPIPSDRASILIVNSMVRRGLVDSEYNRRRAESAEALAVLSEHEGKSFPTLRHAGLTVFERHAGALDEAPRRRARHVVTENQRVLDAREALRRGDIATVGRLFVASHESLRDDFQVSCPQLDTLVELLLGIDGVFGARMTGAGFGGCVVALVEPERAAAAAAEIVGPYRERTGLVPETFITPPCEGARSVKVEEGAVR